jgi:lipopolysaccharide export LptBFGC system permease protein LptF
LALAQQPQTQKAQAAELYAEVANRLTWPLLPFSLVALAAGALLHPPKRKQSSLRGVVLAASLGVVLIGGQFGGLVLVQGGALWGLYFMACWPILFLGVAYGVWVYGQR